MPTWPIWSLIALVTTTLLNLAPTIEQIYRRELLAGCRAPRLRSLVEFAEREVVLPDGPDAGFRYSLSRQPYTRLFFEAIDSGRYNEAAAVGPTQSGKTLSCWVIPILWHLFERGETVVAGLPTMAVAKDKWLIDLLPVIKAGRFRTLLPDRGQGSGGGFSEMVSFRNGATLRFMSGGGDDKQRAAFTTRVVAITEVDGLDMSATTSREADKVTQIKGRTKAFADERQIYLESTASIEEGRIWQEYKGGTESRIVCPCPHCGNWISPEREQLAGWQDAASAEEAAENAFFFCPVKGCGEEITEAERLQANLEAKLLHRGQTITRKGKIKGDHPRTRTLGFRWSAFNNMFAKASDIGAQEWKALRSTDSDNAERELRQFVWALPAESDLVEETPLTLDGLRGRAIELPKGRLPDDTDWLTMGIDLGKFKCHWVLIAWRKDFRAHLVDYGVFLNETDQLGFEPALMASLRTFRDEVVLPGWPLASSEAQRIIPHQVWVDAGYATSLVYQFCRETAALAQGNQRFRPIVGRGAGQQQQEWQQKLKASGAVVKHKGDGFHVAHLKRDRIHLVEINSDHWKSWVHRRVATPTAQPGALTFFQATPQEHSGYCRHLTAERRVEEFVAGKGSLVRWERINKENHWFDATYVASAAGSFCGWKLDETQGALQPAAAALPEERRFTFTSPTGRPFVVTER